MVRAGKTELIHLAADPHEHKDLAAENPVKPTEILAELKSWRGKVGAQMMTRNPAHDPSREKEGPPKKATPDECRGAEFL